MGLWRKRERVYKTLQVTVWCLWVHKINMISKMITSNYVTQAHVYDIVKIHTKTDKPGVAVDKGGRGVLSFVTKAG